MKKYILIITLLLSLPLNTFSATQGLLGLTSTGTINITLNINGVVRISNLSDITLSYTPGTNTDLNSTINVCIYSNNLTSTDYFITATSANASSGTMRVTNGATTPSYIPYTIQWYTQSSGAGTPVSLTSATKNVSAFTGATSVSSTCNSGANPNASFKATFAAADLEASGAGSYTDTLTLLLSSN